MEKISTYQIEKDTNEINFDDFGILITKNKEFNGLISDLIVSIKEENLITEASLLDKLIVRGIKKKKRSKNFNYIFKLINIKK